MIDGPWRKVAHENYMRDDDAPIAVVTASGDTVCCNTSFYPTALDPEYADLIAAAPELLEALRGAVEWMACVEGHLRDGQPFRRNLADYQAAIAKAEGRVD